MKRVLVFSTLLLSTVITTQVYAIDVGDGSDGSCDTAGSATTTLNASKRTYQCTSLTINSNSTVFSGVGGSAVVIKVMGAVTINSGTTLSLAGANGTNGDDTGPTISGGLGGAGGSSGGAGSSTDGNNGNGTGAGVKGLRVSATNSISYGAGGGGGSYGTASSTTATNGHDGTSIISSTLGNNGSTFGSESSFNINSLYGGSGGAAGGAGNNFGSAVIHYGSGGGGGGGALVIVAGGNITVNGTIQANGGNGGGTASNQGHGGGGGGSGGTIWLMSNGTITVSATGSISATGGSQGLNDTSTVVDYGIGGAGGNGRIRLDDSDGVISNFGTISPSAYSTTFQSTVSTTTSTITTNEFKSAVSCGRVSLENKYNFLLNFVFAFSLVGIVTNLSKRNKRI